MVKKSTLRKAMMLSSVAMLALAICAPFALAQEAAGAAASENATASAAGSSIGDGIRIAGLAIGAGIALAAGALGTGRAQASIGAGGTGALAEKPELFTNVLILVAIPETLVVFGFVIAVMIMGRI
jgi:V/A-type H+-transporting ATPase subunit K